MRLLFADWPGAESAFRDLAATLKAMGHDVEFLPPGQEYVKAGSANYKQVPNWNHACNSEVELHSWLDGFPRRPDIVFLWNGNLPGDDMVRRVIGYHGAVDVWAELGWFPQRDTVYFDPEGTNARSTIRHLSLYLCEEGEVDPRLTAFRRSYGGKFYGWGPEGGYILAPLQLERDANIKHYSPFRTMDAFVAHLSRTFPDEQILARPRPGRRTQLSTYPNVTVDNDTDLFEQIARAKFVAGINSTVLLETLLLGKRVAAYGEGLFSGLGVCVEAKPTMSAQEITAQLRRWGPRRRELVDRFLSELVFRRTLRRADLRSVDEVRDYYLFRSWV